MSGCIDILFPVARWLLNLLYLNKPARSHPSVLGTVITAVSRYHTVGGSHVSCCHTVGGPMFLDIIEWAVPFFLLLYSGGSHVS